MKKVSKKNYVYKHHMFSCVFNWDFQALWSWLALYSKFLKASLVNTCMEIKEIILLKGTELWLQMKAVKK